MTPDYLERLNRHNPPNIRMKSFLSSMTIWGFLISLLSRFIGHEVTAEQGASLATQATEAWPMIVGVFADIAVAYRRVSATNFDVGRFASPAFWAALIGGLMSAMQASGVDWSAAEMQLPQKVGVAVASITGLVGFVLQLVGPARASMPLGLMADPGLTPKAAITVPSWAVMLLKLIPWRVLFAYVLQKWLGITPSQFEEIIKTVQLAETKPMDGEQKGLFVLASIDRAYPQFKPHECNAAVALAVAGLASDGQIKLS